MRGCLQLSLHPNAWRMASTCDRGKHQLPGPVGISVKAFPPPTGTGWQSRTERAAGCCWGCRCQVSWPQQGSVASKRSPAGQRGFHTMQPPPAQQLTSWPKGTRCISAARAAPGEGAEPHRPSTGKVSTSQPWGFSLPSLVRKVPFQPLYSAMNRMAVIPTVGHDPRVQD